MLNKIILIVIYLISFNTIADEQDIIKSLSLITDEIIDDKNVMPTDIDGIYEVILTDPIDSIFISSDGRYIVQGEFIDLVARTPRQPNAKLTSLIKSELASINDKDKIIFKAADEKYSVNVFTDVDCPFCGRLHSHMSELNQLGITIKYLASPLEQLHPQAFSRMEKIWCADNRVQAMDDYKKHRIIPKTNFCSNPVAQQLEVAQKIGVNGTPSIFLPDGSKIAGYLPPEQLLLRLQNL